VYAHVLFKKEAKLCCPTQGLRSGLAFVKAGTNMGTDNKKCHYIRGRCSYACRTKQQTTRALWGTNL